jgi:hypothetical protein
MEVNGSRKPFGSTRAAKRSKVAIEMMRLTGTLSMGDSPRRGQVTIQESQKGVRGVYWTDDDGRFGGIFPRVDPTSSAMEGLGGLASETSRPIAEGVASVRVDTNGAIRACAAGDGVF